MGEEREREREREEGRGGESVMLRLYNLIGK
jgi:hypothetical protein